MLAVYRWIAANHPDKYVLKVDSDVVVLLDKVGRGSPINCVLFENHRNPTGEGDSQ